MAEGMERMDSLPGDDKFLSETNAVSKDPQSHDQERLQEDADYTVERVEQVYRCVLSQQKPPSTNLFFVYPYD